MHDDSTTPVEPPLCACGCGQAVAPYPVTTKSRGKKKGEYGKYVSGHNLRLRRKYFTDDEQREALRRNQENFRRRWGTKPKVRSELEKSRAAERTRRYSVERRLWLESLKVGKSCARCGSTPDDLTSLEFHHRDPSTKVREVSQMLTQSMELLLAEIEKCDLLCSPCHHAVHGEWRKAKKMLS